MTGEPVKNLTEMDVTMVIVSRYALLECWT